MDLKKETTKERLIQAGIEAFAANGFEGTTTRMIAEKADCNLAAIPYYFGGKKGLYHAVFESIADVPVLHFKPHIKAIHTFLAGTDRNPETALGLLKKLLGTMVELNCGHSPTALHLQLVIREQLNPSPAFDILYERVISPEVNLISRLVTVITGENDHRTTTLQAFLLISQVMVFRYGREAIVRHLGLQGYSAAETNEIRHLITSWIDKTFTRDRNNQMVA